MRSILGVLVLVAAGWASPAAAADEGDGSTLALVGLPSPATASVVAVLEGAGRPEEGQDHIELRERLASLLAISD